MGKLNDEKDETKRQRTKHRSFHRQTEPISHVLKTESNGCKRTIYTAGRPPWYTADGQLKEPFVIGICGGSASGKTTVANTIIEKLNIPWVSHLCMDSFYKVLNPDQKSEADESNYNFDHPSAFDIDLIIESLKQLKKGKMVQIPIYDFSTHSRTTQPKTIYGANVIIFEGILTLCNPQMRELLDLKVFVDTDADVRLARRLLRDMNERGRSLSSIMDQYHRFVKSSYDQFIAPCMEHADIIIPRGGQNDVAVGVIVQHVTKQLLLRGKHLRFLQAHCNRDVEISEIKSLHILKPTKQVRVLQTLIRDKTTPRDEFIFYSNRLMRLLSEFAASFLPFKDTVVVDSRDNHFPGRVLDLTSVCGVSVLRAGETMETALRDVCKDIALGKILIQTNPDSHEPELHYLRLPHDIRNTHVIVMDPTVASGAAAVMAIRVLIEHDVVEENIIMMSLLMAEQGVKTIAYNYPKVTVVTAAVDKELSDDYHIRPGFGNFGDRYFGTENSD